MTNRYGISRRWGVELDSQRLRAELERRGWRQLDLAEAAGISQMTVSKALRGHRVSSATAGRMAKALDKEPVSPALDALLGRQAP